MAVHRLRDPRTDGARLVALELAGLEHALEHLGRELLPVGGARPRVNGGVRASRRPRQSGDGTGTRRPQASRAAGATEPARTDSSAVPRTPSRGVAVVASDPPPPVNQECSRYDSGGGSATPRWLTISGAKTRADPTWGQVGRTAYPRISGRPSEWRPIMGGRSGARLLDHRHPSRGTERVTTAPPPVDARPQTPRPSVLLADRHRA
jgi:hypothetical protein